ncbi:hypothetical protein Catovirus_1_391 [Catovirus CTV1]|uniref:Band 7 domain-containing protein n=1 Tax=Catovirus CTV1 TaxID=1977631 RepID=A0A1V0S9G8_9VIRU|nr:hypothetical protein Catovirus_1_391 [Catovirus CTV1]
MIGLLELIELLSVYYCAATPQTYIAKTGFGVNTIRVSKSTLKLPFQKVTKINIAPQNVDTEVNVITLDLYQIKIPVSFTLGINKHEVDKHITNANIKKFAVFYIKNDAYTTKMILKNIVESSVSENVNNMKLIEIFTRRNEITKSIINTINKALMIYGLRIYCANIKNISEQNSSTYFFRELQSLIDNKGNSIDDNMRNNKKLSDLNFENYLFYDDANPEKRKSKTLVTREPEEEQDEPEDDEKLLEIINSQKMEIKKKQEEINSLQQKINSPKVTQKTLPNISFIRESTIDHTAEPEKKKSLTGADVVKKFLDFKKEKEMSAKRATKTINVDDDFQVSPKSKSVLEDITPGSSVELIDVNLYNPKQKNYNVTVTNDIPEERKEKVIRNSNVEHNMTVSELRDYFKNKSTEHNVI